MSAVWAAERSVANNLASNKCMFICYKLFTAMIENIFADIVLAMVVRMCAEICQMDCCCSRFDFFM